MNRYVCFIVLFLLVVANLLGQQNDSIKHNVVTWRLIDDFSYSDSVAVDTLAQGFQYYNPVLKKNLSAIHLGNMGSYYRSNMIDGICEDSRFLFRNGLDLYFVDAEDVTFYNTRTPYTNLTYINGPPKRRSEENVSVLFTQNINPDWNVGAKYNLVSSIGKYASQKVDNRNFTFFSSYSGAKYSAHGAFIYNKADHTLNGGLLNDATVIEDVDNQNQESAITVNLSNAGSKVENYQLFLNQKFNVGKVEQMQMDSSIVELPIATASHTVNYSGYTRNFKVASLENAYKTNYEDYYFQDVFQDSLQTYDSVSYKIVTNTFQLKFNEEANPYLRFGVRAFLTNEVEHYVFGINPSSAERTVDGARTYLYSDSTLVSTLVGGQIFKNEGDNFWWNAGVKLYLQGYRIGDFDLSGQINSQFRIFNDTAGVFAQGRMILKTPDILKKRYFSNHLQWDKDFGPEKVLKARLGFRIPTRAFEVSAESKILYDYIFWNTEAVPEQAANLIQLYALHLDKKFSVGPLHSNFKFAYQYTSNPSVVPLPELAAYNSTYLQGTLAKVLFFQLGVDVRYHSKFYTPDFMPATGQFFMQKERVVGDYPFVDAFVNLHLKRARIFVKYEHINQGYPNNNYFLSVGYPDNPMSLKFGVSWNFYD